MRGLAFFRLLSLAIARVHFLALHWWGRAFGGIGVLTRFRSTHRSNKTGKNYAYKFYIRVFCIFLLRNFVNLYQARNRVTPIPQAGHTSFCTCEPLEL